jgi:hypothetical protein
MIPFIIKYHLAILNILNLVFWTILYIRLDRNRRSIKLFVMYFLLFTVWDFSMIISNNSWKVYLLFWSIISIYQLYFVFTILIELVGRESKWSALPLVAIPSLPVILASIFSVQFKSYQPVNTADFFTSLLLFTGSLLVLREIIFKKPFWENIETFFIFSGLILYFGLHLLASNVLVFGELRHWIFASNASLVSLVYFLGSTICIQSIRSRYSL